MSKGGEGARILASSWTAEAPLYWGNGVDGLDFWNGEERRGGGGRESEP